jgi:cytidine deaminase
MDDSFNSLLAAARAVQQRAYAPFSRFRVGCALQTPDGQVYCGCNIENQSFGATLCAERVALGAAVAAGRREFKSLVLVTDAREPATPCGVCRQVLSEFAPALEIVSVAPNGATQHWTLTELLPVPFEYPPEDARA